MDDQLRKEVEERIESVEGRLDRARNQLTAGDEGDALEELDRSVKGIALVKELIPAAQAEMATFTQPSVPGPPEVSGETKEKSWRLFICDQCGLPGWAFGHRACNSGDHTHAGKHGGPVEVMPVSEHEATVERLECERENARACEDEAAAEASRAETALNEAAAEFERQAKEASDAALGQPLGSFSRANCNSRRRANEEAAQLLREKQAALKGGTDE